MSNKTIGILLILCVVFGYFGLKKSDSNKGNNIIPNTAPFKKLSINKVKKVEITQGDKKVILQLSQENKTWNATVGELSFPVNFKKFKDFLISVTKISLIDKKANSDKYDQKFGLDEKSEPIIVNLSSGSSSIAMLKLGNIRKGKRVGTGSYSYEPEEGHYLKIGSEKNVYLAKDKVKVEMNNDFWLQKEIVKIDKEKVTSFALTFPHKGFSVSKQTTPIPITGNAQLPPKQITTWVAKGDLPEGYNLNQGAVTNFLTTISEFEVSEPANSSLKEKMGLGESYSISVKEGEIELYTLNVSRIDNAWYVVNSKMPSQVYKVDSYKLDKIFANNKSLFSLNEKVVVTAIDSYSNNEGLSFNVDKEKNWTVDGVNNPELKKDALNELMKTVKKLQIKDYHKVNVPKEAKNKLIVKNGSKETTISFLGDIAMDDQKIIQISGIKGAFSISENTYNQLFLKQSDVLKFEAQPSSIDDLKSIAFPSFSLSKKEDKWMSGDKEVEQNRVSDWLDSLKNVFDSPYNFKATTFKPENVVTLKDKNDKNHVLKIGVPAKGFAIVSYSQFGGNFKVRLEVVKSLLKVQKNFLVAIEEKSKTSN
jgi:hypothetical protein